MYQHGLERDALVAVQGLLPHDRHATYERSIGGELEQGEIQAIVSIWVVRVGTALDAQDVVLMLVVDPR